MKKTTLFMIIVSIVAMATSDALSQRGGGRGGGGPRAANGGVRMNRPMPGHSIQAPMNQTRSMRLQPSQANVKNTIRERPGTLPSQIKEKWPNYKEGAKFAQKYPNHPPYHPPYHHHHRYYHGWQPGWWTLPVAWGIGATWWDWNTPDTYVYYNPYVTYVADPVYNYAVPVYTYSGDTAVNQDKPLPATEGSPATEATQNEPTTAEEQSAMQYFETARNAFKDANYTKALEEVNRAIEIMPNDAVLHEFRGLSLFAIGKYNQAAAVVNSALASGPGWSWETMISLYKDPEQYTKQLRNLEEFVDQHEKDSAAKFLLAYQYLVMGYTDHAEAELKEVVKLQPKDVLSQRLLHMIEQSQTEGNTVPVTPPAPGK